MNEKAVVIVGGGFAGSRLAASLERTLPANWSIQLLCRDNFITYNPLLPEVVGASLLPGHVVAPLRQVIKRTKVSMVEVTGVDFANRTVSYLGEGTGTISYDHLVFACGQSANLGIIKGMARYALPLKTLGDSLFLRNRAIVRLEQAELQPDSELRRWLTTFVVIGGGFSGVEVAGELADFLRASRRYYRSLDDVRVQLVHSGDRLLPELTPSLGRFAHEKMMQRGIQILLDTRVTRVDARGIFLDNGETIAAGTIICTIGTAANPLVRELDLPSNRGRISVLADMSVPSLQNVWALGDCAAVPNARDGGVCPPTAQYADRQARQLAKNIARSVTNQPTTPFSYKPVGQLSAIGHNKAVAELFGIRLAGFAAWLLWRGVYLLKIPTVGRKVRLFLEWNWAMFFPPDIAHLAFTRTRRMAGAAATESRETQKAA